MRKRSEQILIRFTPNELDLVNKKFHKYIVENNLVVNGKTITRTDFVRLFLLESISKI